MHAWIFRNRVRLLRIYARAPLPALPSGGPVAATSPATSETVVRKRGGTVELRPARRTSRDG